MDCKYWINDGSEQGKCQGNGGTCLEEACPENELLDGLMQCPTCEGDGLVVIEGRVLRSCPRCDGMGLLVDDEGKLEPLAPLSLRKVDEEPGLLQAAENLPCPPQSSITLDEAEYILATRKCPHCGHKVGEIHEILRKKLCYHQVLAADLIRKTRQFNMKHLGFVRALEVLGT